jgi:Cu/Zn superoxide dismutase
MLKTISLLLLTTLFTLSLQQKTVAICKFVGDKSNKDEDLQGNIKFLQMDDEKHVTVKIKMRGFIKSKKYGFVVHEKGDVSNKCKNVGGVFQKPQGYLATLTSNKQGEIEADIKNVGLRVKGDKKYSVLGRSCVIHKPKDQSYEAKYSVESADKSNDKIVDCAKI